MILKILICVVLVQVGVLYYFFGRRKTLRILGIELLSFIGLVLAIVILINFSSVQNFLISRVTASLSGKLHTEVEIRHVDFQFFDRMSLDGVLVKDQRKDTLLYAGRISVRITDFFFLKNRPVLHYAGLQHVWINLVRPPGDSEWNYQFLADEFGSHQPSSPSSPGGMDLDLRQISMKDLHIRKLDSLEGENMELDLGGLSLDARSVDLKHHFIQVTAIALNNPIFRIQNITPQATPGSRPAAGAAASGRDSLSWNPEGWRVIIKSLSVRDGEFTLSSNQDLPEADHFDPAHMVVTGINADLVNFRVVKDSLLANIRMSASERSGLQVRKLSARVKLSPVEMEFANLDLVTNRSHIRNYFAMHFESFADMGNFLSRVIMQARFQNTTVSSDDIAFFAPALSSWKTQFGLSGLAYGTVSNFSATTMDIRAGASSSLTGSFQIIGLPDIDHTYIDFSAKQLRTTSIDLVRFIPSLRTSTSINLAALNNLGFTGNFTGFIRDFVAYGNFTSDLGSVRCDVDLKNPGSGAIPSYSGNIASTDLDLGTLLGITFLGKTTLEAKIIGQGFKLDQLKAELNSNIDHIDLQGYDYHNLKVNGEFAKKLFNGLLLVQDPNLSLLFQGKMDFSGRLPDFNFNATVSNSDLRALRLTSDSMLFSGQLDLDFSGNTIDNFLGTAKLYNINLYKNAHRVAFDSLELSTAVTDSVKTLTLKGNEIDGYVKGVYQLHALPNAVQLFLTNYFPSVIKKPAHAVPAENFSFALHLGKVDSLLRTFTSNLYGFNMSQVSGNLNTSDQKFNLSATVPSGGIGKYRFDNINLKGEGDLRLLGIQASIAGVYSNDSLEFPNTSIMTSSTMDSSFIELKTQATSTLNEANLTARVITTGGGYDIAILNSQVVINDKTWKIPSDNDLFISKTAFRVRNFSITNNDQRISVSSGETTGDSTGEPFLEMQLSGLNINDFTTLARIPTRMEGLANGSIRILDPLGHLRITGQISATDFRLENDSIGGINLSGGYGQGLLTLHATTQDARKSFAVDGTIGLSAAQNGLNLQLNLNGLDASVLNNYLTTYVYNLSGYASGHLNVTGTLLAPEVDGNLRLDSMGLVVRYLKTYYRFNQATVNFSSNTIDLGTIVLNDPFQNTATLTGQINHDHFHNLIFDCEVRTPKFQFLNTDEADNSLFYGSVFASGTISLTGPLSDLQMVANVTPAKNTHLYLPLSSGTDVDKHDFIVFKSYGTELKAQHKIRHDVNLTFLLNASMNSQAIVDVILDPSTGDDIQASGNGLIKLEFSINGSLNLFGTYSIDAGSYTFTYQRLLTKKFTISQGSTISWNGSPYNATMKVDAIYSVPGGASLYDLISGDIETSSGFLTDEDKDLAERKEKVDVYLILTGRLLKPDIQFDIRLPDAGIAVASYAMTRLEQVKQDNSELTQEVAWLLLFNQFYPVTPTTNNSNIIRSGGLTSVGQFLSATATTQLNSLLGKVVKDKTVGFNVDYDAYSASGQTGDPLQRNEVRVGITKSLANNRIKLEAGPSLDWGTNYANNQYSNSSAFAGDFQFEYLITPDGRIRTTVFRRSNYDVLLNGTLTVFGATLAYKRDFDKFSDLFNSKRLKERADSVEQVAYRQAVQNGTVRDTTSTK